MNCVKMLKMIKEGDINQERACKAPAHLSKYTKDGLLKDGDTEESSFYYSVY